MTDDVKEAKPSLLATLRVPVHPDYDWDSDPADQAAYTNPVVVANKQVQLANAAIFVTQRSLSASKRVADCKEAIQKVESQLVVLERSVLAKHNPPVAYTKTHRLLDAHIAMVADEEDATALCALRVELRERARELRDASLEIESTQLVFNAIRLAGDHLKTYLAFVKFETTR